jgi:hypothetical protein
MDLQEQPDTEQETTSEARINRSPSIDNIISITDGKSLSLREASEIIREENTLLFTIAGPQESGKTTILASIWELILNGEFGDYLFAGSKTLPGFEKRCFESRISSGRHIATTQHTGLAENSILHLKMRKSDLNEEATNILFSDLAGERYRLAKDSLLEAKKMNLIPRSDHFILLIDGGKIIDKSKRQEAISDTRLILRSFLDSGMLNKNSFIDIVFSKWDLIVLDLNMGGDIIKFTNIIESDLRRNFESKFGMLNFFKIAARPEPSSGLPFGYNLVELFQSNLENIPIRQFVCLEDLDLSEKREIDRFNIKSNGKHKNGI